MPTSSPEGKEQMLAWLNGPVRVTAGRARPRGICVLDIGPGEGTYARLMATDPRHDRRHDRLVAVEVWGPYVEKYGLAELYDHVEVGDARLIDLARLPGAQDAAHRWDAVVLGDVVEHMPEIDAADLLHRLHGLTPYVLVSLPIVHWPQGAVHGNPYEAHVAHWSPGDVDDVAGRTGWQVTERQLNSQVGVFLLAERPQVIGEPA